MNKERLDYYTGKVKSVMSGYAVDPEISANAASGGVVSGLLAGMLARGEIDGALVYRSSVVGGKLHTESLIARTREELLSAQGSIYSFSPPLGRETMEQLRSFPGKLAVVGLPCAITALNKILESDRALREKIVLRIGLFCGSSSRPELLHRVLECKGIRMDDLKEFRFRRGLWRGHSEAVFHDGSRRTWPTGYYNLYKNLFILCHSHCMSCSDHFAEEADLSCGDVWLMKHRNDKIKHSIVAARSDGGHAALENARGCGDLFLQGGTQQLLLDSNKRAAVFHKALRARSGVGRLCRIPVRVPD